MFGFRKGITNEECEIIAIKGRLDGLTKYYLSLVKISNRPDNRSDLTDEINRVKSEIKINEEKLGELNNNS